MSENFFAASCKSLGSKHGGEEGMYRLATEHLLNEGRLPNSYIKISSIYGANPLGLKTDNFVLSEIRVLPFKDVCPLYYAGATPYPAMPDEALAIPLIVVCFENDKKLRLIDGSHRILEFKRRGTALDFGVNVYFHKIQLSESQMQTLEAIQRKISAT